MIKIQFIKSVVQVSTSNTSKTPKRRPSRPWTPASSQHSRSAACSGFSLNSIPPPGIIQQSLFRLLEINNTLNYIKKNIKKNLNISKCVKKILQSRSRFGHRRRRLSFCTPHCHKSYDPLAFLLPFFYIQSPKCETVEKMSE